MKLFKKLNYVYVFAVTLLITSCQTETDNLNEEQLQNKANNYVGQEFMGDSVSKSSKTSERPILTYEHFSENNILNFYEDSNSFLNSCNPVMQIEDFEDSEVLNGWGFGTYGNIIDESSDIIADIEGSDYALFSPGSIESNVKFSTLLDNGELAWIWVYKSWPFTGAYGNQVLTSRNWIDYADDLHIEFTKSNNYSVSLELFPDSAQDITIEIYGESGLLGYSEIYGAYSGNFWGIHSSESIKEVVLKTTNILRLGIDNLSFGYCDSDNDGVPNAEDPYPYSILNEEIDIDDCYPNVENVFVSPGTTMMDEIANLISEINKQYDGENYDDLHDDFTRELSKLTYAWRKDRLITRRERSAISSCGWRVNIPESYMNQ
ncbi:hypothetical protein BX611_0397 [Lutibacter oceani]|uniref:Uncharacterized protein n=1 Tax=Lutibacter oceani TaxID=1853311 RepID=A0A3D9RTC0_9FLAO|nr:hypothetical protein [Lutibacter oceani]REE83117.1 hypothetical protein BX611_0397 [Lutibacter oceani]